MSTVDRGYSRPLPPDERRQIVYELITKGLHNDKIASNLGVSNHTIYADVCWWRQYFRVSKRTPLQEFTDGVWAEEYK